jgi:hypothetical protein
MHTQNMVRKNVTNLHCEISFGVNRKSDDSNGFYIHLKILIFEMSPHNTSYMGKVRNT